MICPSGSEISSHMLPPSQQPLRKHMIRGNFQTYIWRKSLAGMKDLPGPYGYGWMINKWELLIDWSYGKAAPDSVIEMMSCKYKKGCKTNKCSCVSYGISCTVICKCEACENIDNEDDDKIDEFSMNYIEDADDEEDLMNEH